MSEKRFVIQDIAGTVLDEEQAASMVIVYVDNAPDQITVTVSEPSVL